MSGPLPRATVDSAPFWEGCAAGELRLQRCERGHWRFPPGPLCPECWSRASGWERASGRARVVTHVTFRRVYHPAFATLVPYTVAVVELEEGPRMTTRLTGVAPEDVRAGMPVVVTFEDAGAGVRLPLFRTP